MAVIDERIVSLIFDNSKFNNNVDDSVKKMDELKKGLDFKGVEAGLQVLQDSVGKMSSKFSAFGVAGFTAIQRLTNSAITFGKTIATSVIDPIIKGGMKRAENIEQAKFMFQGLMKDSYKWADIEKDLMYAVKGTAYGMDDAAKAASSLYASGVKLTAQNGKMGQSLRAISGVAAMTGSEYSDIANTFTRVAGQGRVMAVDLNSLAAAGLNAAADMGRAWKKSEAEVREMVKNGEISFEEFAAVMDKFYGEHAKKANETYAGAMKNMYAALSRLGAKFASEYLTNMRDIFNALGPQIDNISKALQPLITIVNDSFKTGTKALVQFINSIEFVGKYSKPITDILDAVNTSGKVTMKNLKDLSKNGQDGLGALAMSLGISEEKLITMVKKGKVSLADFNKAMEDNRPRSFFEDTIGYITELDKPLKYFLTSVNLLFSELMISTGTSSDGLNYFMEMVKAVVTPVKELFMMMGVAVNTFARNGDQVAKLGAVLGGVGAIFHIIWVVVQRVGQALSEAFGGSQMGSMLQNIFDFAAGIGTWLINLDKAISSGEGLNNFFAGIANVVSFVSGVFSEIGVMLQPAFDAISKFFGGFGDSVVSVEAAGSRLQTIFLTLQNIVAACATVFWDIMGPALTAFGAALKPVSDAVSKFVDSLTFGDIATAGGIASVAVIGKMIANLVETLVRSQKIFTGDVGIGFTLKMFATNLKNSMAIMESSFKADVLVKYALAIGILAVSLLIMSSIPADKLIVAVGAMGILFKGLLMMMGVLSNANFSLKLLFTLGAVASAVMTFAIALGILAIAVRILGSMGFDELAKGLFGVAALLQGIFTIMEKSAKNTKEFAAAGIGLIAIAIAMNILAGAVKLFGMMSIEEILKGVGAINISLLAIVSIMKLAEPTKLLAAGAAMIGIAIAATILAGAVKLFGMMSIEEILKGVSALTVSLAAIVAAVQKTDPAKMMAFGAAMLAVSIAVNILAGAFKIFATMSWEEVFKATVAMGLSIGILVGAMLLMSNPAILAGAAALLIASFSLMMLAPALVLLGTMSWDAIGRGMAVLAAAIGILAVGGLLLLVAIPGFIGLGLAVMMIGAGMALAGNGVVAFAKGLAALAGALTLFIPVAMMGATSIASLAPVMATAFGEGLISLIKVISANGTAIVDLFVTILDSVLTALTNEAPKLIDTGVLLLTKLLEGLQETIPVLIETTVTIISALLDGLQVVVPQVIALGATIVLGLLRAMEVLIPKVVSTGMKILNGVLDGIGKNIKKTVEKGTKIVTEFIAGVAEGLPKIIDSGAKLIIAFLNGIADAITANSAAIGRAGGRIATALIDGLVRGIGAGHQEVMNKIGQLATDAIDWAKRLLGIHSPSKVFKEIGEYVTQGFVDGITGGIPWSAPIKSEIEEAFNVLRDNLSTFVTDTEKDIKAAQAKLKKLNKKKKKNKKEIAKTKAEIENDKAEVAKAKAAQKALEAQRKAEEEHLKKLNKAYEENTTQLEAAVELLNARNQYADNLRNTYGAIPDLMKNDSYTEALNKVTISYNDLIANLDDAQKALIDIQKTMDDTAKSIKDQYSKIPGMGADTNFGTFTKDLEDQIAATEKYAQSLQTLRSIGVDDATYATLVSQGTAGQAFVDQLLAVGPDGLSQIKDLYAKLGDAATNLGTMVSQDFYKSGENAAQAVVDGLMSQEAAARAAVDAASTDYVSGFEADIQKQIEANNKIAQDLAILRKLGLSDSAYAELVSKGTNAQPFITDLLKKGAAGVSQLNILMGNLDASAKALGDKAADELYRVGEQTAQGLVDGLRAKRKEIEDEMNAIAASLVDTLKKLLGIKSPSRVFMGIGGYITQGLAEGIQNQDGLVRNASTELGNTATDTLRKSLSDMAGMLMADVNSNPTITPVLDLTTFRKDAASMNSMAGSMSVGTTYSRASTIAMDDRDLREQIAASIEEAANVSTGDEVIFNQYNSSPKALSNSEIYRRTSNQISSIKGVSRR